MTVAEKIEKVRALAITARATIYNEDAMTAIELAGVTACKVNECVDAVNGILEIVESIGRDIGLHYKSEDESIVI